MDGKQTEVLVKDLQEDIITETVKHIDFYEIEKGKVLKTHVPVRLEGNPVGVKEGGLLEQKIDQFEVECLPKDLPETISVDVSELNMGNSIHVGDVELPEGVKVLDAEDRTVVVVTAPKSEAVASDEEESEEAAEA
jgi:large subunit ribosomal protein L25